MPENIVRFVLTLWLMSAVMWEMIIVLYSYLVAVSAYNGIVDTYNTHKQEMDNDFSIFEAGFGGVLEESFPLSEIFWSTVGKTKGIVITFFICLFPVLRAVIAVKLFKNIKKHSDNAVGLILSGLALQAAVMKKVRSGDFDIRNNDNDDDGLDD